MVTKLPVGTVTFFFTDIEGSTPLWERKPEKMAEALQIHNTSLCQAIEDRWRHSFRLLAGGSRTPLERHRTLRAAIDWSYNLLTEKERLLWTRKFLSEQDNFSAALIWALQENIDPQSGLRIVIALLSIYLDRARFADLQRWLEKGLDEINQGNLHDRRIGTGKRIMDEWEWR